MIDPLLQKLVAEVEAREREPFGITLWVGGTILTGKVVSVREYGSEESGEEISPVDLVPEAEAGDCIHLSDARLFGSTGFTPAAGERGLIWRGKLESVDGYVPGRLTSS